MRTWVIKDMDGSILWNRTYDSEQEAQDVIDGMSYFGDMLTAVEVDINKVTLPPTGSA